MPETVGITIDTFQTVLNLMKEYPQFVFSQSRASIYEIIEKYCPSMLPEIRERIHEGRWEITASQWVEGGKNMAGTEALCRHLLYTKEYLSKLFDIDPNSMADSAGVGVKEKAPFAHARKKVLFNHFHDILPGSGIPETCQYSLGIFREALSAATANANRAMRAIAENTDTTLWGDVFDPESQAEGGGVGAGVMQNPSMDLTMVAKYDFGTTGRAGGSVRPYTLLQFYAPFGYAPVCYRCDEAAGVIDRAAPGHDVPALTYAAAVPEEGRGIMVTSNVMRLGNPEGAEASAAVSLGGCASFADVCENACETVSVGEKHTLNIPAKALRTVKIS